MVNNYKNKKEQSGSLNQGKEYFKNKNKLKSSVSGNSNIIESFDTNNLASPLFRKAYKSEKNAREERRNSILEGFGGENLDAANRLDNVQTRNEDINNELSGLYKQFEDKIQEYQREKSRISNITRDYLLRTGDSNILRGKNVRTDDGVKGYVTERGVFKKYPDDATYQSIVGQNNCPRDKDLVTIEQRLDNISNSMSPMILGTNMESQNSKARYVRIEHSKQYLHVQEVEVYSGEDNIAKISTEIQDDRANENETFNCTGTVYFGKKEGDNGEILSYDEMIKSSYKTLDNTGNFTCSNSSFSSDTYSEEREYPPVPISLSTTISGKSSTSTGTVSSQSYGNGTYTITVQNSQHNVNSSIENGNLTLMSKQPKIGTQLGGTAAYPVYYNTIQGNNVATITYPVTIYFTKVIITGYQSNSIYNPQAITVEGSTDGSTFTTINGSNKYDASSGNLTFTATTQTELKYIKLTGTTNTQNAVWSEIYTYGKEKGTGDPLPGVAKQCLCKVTKGGATVTTSSNGWNGQPVFTVDGNKDDNQSWPNSNHTQNGDNEWLELDLNDDYMVSRIVIYNRPDCCQDRLNGAKIKILDSSRKQIYPTIGLTSERLQEFMIRTLPKGQTCGSEGENVFVNKYPDVKDEQPTYLGCFGDKSDRRMDWDGAPYMSFNDCKQKAIDNRSTFFALQDTQSDGLSACMLSNNIVKATSEGPAISYDYTWATNITSSEQNIYYLYLDHEGDLSIRDSSNNDNIVWQTNTASLDDTANQEYIKFRKTDFPGNDIEGKAMTRSECRDYCNDNNECVGYNVSRNSNFCWFKKELGNKTNTDSWNFFAKGRRTFLAMRNDGNLSLYTGHPRDGVKTSKRKLLWSSNTANNEGLVVEEWKPDKNSSNKYKTNYLLPGQRLEANKSISSNNGKRIAIMQSDGNFVIYKAGSKCVNKQDFIGGSGWTNAIYMLNDTKISSKKGQFVNGNLVSEIQPRYEKIQLGECMSLCEGSNECNSFSYGKLNEKDENNTCMLYRNIPMTTDDNVNMKSYQPNIKNPFQYGWENAGKMGYVDENAILHEYPSEFKGWKNEYDEMLNTDSKYNDIKSGVIDQNESVNPLDSVKEMCNNDPNCAGFVFTPADRKYWLKNENMYPIGKKTSNVNGVNLYVRKRDVKPNSGCSTNINEITSREWDNYVKGETYNENIRCGLSNTLDNNRLVELENDLQNIISKITDKIKILSSLNYDNSIQAEKEQMLLDAKIKQMEEIRKNIERVETPKEKDDYLDTVLNSKNQSFLPGLFNFWFRDTSGNNTDASKLTDVPPGTSTSSGSATEPSVCENQAACMDDLTTFDQKVESFKTLTTPFKQHQEDFGMLTLGTLAIVGTMFAFSSCNKCK